MERSSYFFDLLDTVCEGLNRIRSTYKEDYIESARAKVQVMSNMREISSLVNNVLGHIKPRIEWTTSGRTLKLVHFSGSVPWDFWLQWPDSENIREKMAEIRSVHQLNPLLAPPKVGDVVCSIYRGRMYRCVVVSGFAGYRIKVADVDGVTTRFVELDEIYELPRRLAQFKPLMLHCQIIRQNEIIRKVWDDDLGNVFSTAIRSCELSVDIDRSSNSFPPICKVRIVGFNQELKSFINFNEWIQGRLAPAIYGLVQGDTTKNLLSKLDKNAIDPYYVVKESLAASLTSTEAHDGRQTPQKVLTEKAKDLELWVTGQHTTTKRAIDAIKPDGFANPDYYVRKTGVAASVQAQNEPHFQTINPIKLPQIGESVAVFVASIHGPTSVYCHLPLDLSGPGFFDRFMEKMNDPFEVASFSTLERDPYKYEIVIALNGEGKWVRAVVQEIIGSEVKIFNPDQAVTSKTSLSNIRKIKHEFLYPPFQAVLLKLSGVHARGTGNLNVLGKMILWKVVRVEVTNSDENFACIHGTVTTMEGVNVNEALIQSGTCDRIQDSPFSSYPN